MRSFLVPRLDEIPDVPQDAFDHIHCKGIADTLGLEDGVEARAKAAPHSPECLPILGEGFPENYDEPITDPSGAFRVT